VNRSVNVHEAKTHFSKLLERVMAGERVVIAKAGKPVAVLSPIAERPPKRVLGKDAGRVVIHEDFDEPLPEFQEYV
jgi:prevent-host-death family protein